MSRELHTRSVKLTDDELIQLDGKCRPETQEEVRAAWARVRMAVKYDEQIPIHLAGLVADIVAEARAEGRLTFRHVRIRWCGYCGRDAGETKKRGKTVQLTMGGIELAERFIRIEGHINVGCCSECWDQIATAVVAELAPVPVEAPEVLKPTGPRYRRWDRRECTACGWTGHEGQMLPAMTLMGDGYYAARCPSCGVENAAFGRHAVKGVPGHVVEEDAPASMSDEQVLDALRPNRPGWDTTARKLDRYVLRLRLNGTLDEAGRSLLAKPGAEVAVKVRP
jgi:hypothetical protein